MAKELTRAMKAETMAMATRESYDIGLLLVVPDLRKMRMNGVGHSSW
jgi:hypothetical protein